MTTKPDASTSPSTEQKLPPAARVTLLALGALALALGGAGAAYAGSAGVGETGEPAEDSAWVTVVEDDAPHGRSGTCPDGADEGDL